MSLYLELARLCGLMAQSSRLSTLPETFDINSKELRSNYQIRWRSPHNTTDFWNQLQVQDFPQTSRFTKSQKGPTEFTESSYTHGYSLL